MNFQRPQKYRSRKIKYAKCMWKNKPTSSFRTTLALPPATLKKAEVMAQNSTAYDSIWSLPLFTAHVWACDKYILPVMNHGSNSLLLQEKMKVTYRLPVHSLRKLSVWVETTVNIRRIPAIEPETMFLFQSAVYTQAVQQWLWFCCDEMIAVCMDVYLWRKSGALFKSV